MDVLSKRSSSTCTLSSSHSDSTLQQQIEGGDVYSKELVERILKQQYSSGNEMATLECSKELFAVIVTLERLESSYGSGRIDDDEYTKQCKYLMGQAKINHSTLRGQYRNITDFISAHNMTCPRATTRFLIGVPATVENGITNEVSNTEDIVAFCEVFTTVLDVFALNPDGFTVDTITCYMDDALKIANKLAPQVPSRSKLVEWCGRLSHMHAADMISESDARQMKLDMEKLYYDIKTAVSNN